MKEKFYPLLEDFVFKRVFGDRKNTAKLALLLESVLPLEEYGGLDTLVIENTHVERTWDGDKLIILDIRAAAKNGRVFAVELQVAKTRFFRFRLVYYLSKLVAEQLRRGHQYDRLRPVWCVAVCNFSMTPGRSRYIHRFALREEETGELFTGLQNIVIIELPKMPCADDGTGAWPVLECFRCKTIEEAEMHAITYPRVKEIVADLRGFSLVKEFRAAYDLAMKARRDRKMWQDEYHARGMEEGLQEGAAREREKWDAVRSENEAVRSENEAVMSENEAVMSENEELRRELERLRRAGQSG